MIAWFQFLSLDIGSVFRCIKKFFILTQVNKVFLGLLYLAATSLLLPPFPRSSSAWHFSRSALWVYFSFPTTNILRRNNTTTWRKSKQKNTHKYLASFKALKQSYISTCDSSIRKFGIFLKRGMHISPNPFRIFCVQTMKTLSGWSNGQKSKFRWWRRTADSLHFSFFWRSKIS